jgi:calmodulin-regulated spectrin-associated protein
MYVYVFFSSRMNTSLSEIQQDIQRLANQQNQIQQQHLMSQHQQQMQQLQQLQSLSHQHLHVSFRKIQLII